MNARIKQYVSSMEQTEAINAKLRRQIQLLKLEQTDLDDSLNKYDESIDDEDIDIEA